MALQQLKMGQVIEICYCSLPASEQQQQAKHIFTLIGGVLETKEIITGEDRFGSSSHKQGQGY